MGRQDWEKVERERRRDRKEQELKKAEWVDPDPQEVQKARTARNEAARARYAKEHNAKENKR